MLEGWGMNLFYSKQGLDSFLGGKIRANRFSRAIKFMVMSLIILMIWGWYQSNMLAQNETPLLQITPSSWQILVDDTTTSQIALVGNSSPGGVTMVIEYDPRYLTLLVDDITAGPALAELDKGVDYFLEFTSLKTVTDSVTQVEVAIAFVSEVSLNEGALLQLTWLGKTLVNNTTITINPELSGVMNEQGNLIQPKTGEATVEVVETLQPGVLQISLEGGKSVTVVQTQQGIHQTKIVLDGTIIVVDDTGQTELSNLPYQQIEIARPGYMTATGENINQAKSYSITLLAGDVNGDDQIDIFDIAQLASFYGETAGPPLSAEFEVMNYVSSNSGTNIIDIFDLVLVAQNYGQVGPITME